MYARIFYRGSDARMFSMFLAFALAGFVTCEWLLAATDELPDADQRVSQVSDRQYDRPYPAELNENAPERKDQVTQTPAIYPRLAIPKQSGSSGWEGLYEIPRAECDISEQHPLVVSFSFQ